MTTTPTPTLRGVATLSYWADDLSAARAWYSELLGVEPYFAMPPAPAAPAYLEYRIGDSQDELGLIDRRYAPGAATATGPGGVVAYWHVDDLPAMYERLLSMGATGYQEPTERGHGFVTAAVIDPFGNILGVMYNPHYVEVLATITH